MKGGGNAQGREEIIKLNKGGRREVGEKSTNKKRVNGWNKEIGIFFPFLYIKIFIS